MKCPSILLFSAAVILAQFNESQGPSSSRVKDLSIVSTSFTDKNNYNTFSHASNPIGVFETESGLLSFAIGHRYLGWKNKANLDSSHLVNSFIMPRILVGASDKIYLGLNYSLNPTSRSDEIERISMPFNSFGLFLVGQTEDGRFQFGIKGQGYTGKKKPMSLTARVLSWVLMR